MSANAASIKARFDPSVSILLEDLLSTSDRTADNSHLDLLENLESTFTIGQRSSSNLFDSLLQASASDCNLEMNKEESFDERFQKSISVASGIGPNEPRRMAPKESFDDRLKKKMAESDNSRIKSERKIYRPEKVEQQPVAQRLRGRSLGNSAEANTYKSIQDRQRAAARESFEDRLKKKMAESDTGMMTSERKVDGVKEVEQLPVAQRGRGKSPMNPAQGHTHKSIEDRQRVAARESFEVRLKKKMAESDTGMMTKERKVDGAKEIKRHPVVQQRGSGGSPINPAEGHAYKSIEDRQRVAARESFEDRLKKKMAESDTGMMTSERKVDGVKEVKQHPVVQRERGRSLGNSAEGHAYKLIEDRQRVAARESFEDRLKKKMAESDTGMMTSERKVDGVKEVEQLPVSQRGRGKSPMNPAQGHTHKSIEDRQRVAARESFEDRLKKKMAESDTGMMTKERKVDGAKEIKRHPVVQQRGSGGSPINPAEGHTYKSIEDRQRVAAKESFEDRLKKKMAESDTGMMTSERKVDGVKEVNQHPVERMPAPPRGRASDALRPDPAKPSGDEPPLGRQPRRTSKCDFEVVEQQTLRRRAAGLRASCQYQKEITPAPPCGRASDALGRDPVKLSRDEPSPGRQPRRTSNCDLEVVEQRRQEVRRRRRSPPSGPRRGGLPPPGTSLAGAPAPGSRSERPVTSIGQTEFKGRESSVGDKMTIERGSGSLSDTRKLKSPKSFKERLKTKMTKSTGRSSMQKSSAASYY